MLITIFQSVSYYQLANVLPVWIQEHVDLKVGSLAIPIPWYQSIDALLQHPRGARALRDLGIPGLTARRAR